MMREGIPLPISCSRSSRRHYAHCARRSKPASNSLDPLRYTADNDSPGREASEPTPCPCAGCNRSWRCESLRPPELLVLLLGAVRLSESAPCSDTSPTKSQRIPPPPRPPSHRVPP